LIKIDISGERGALSTSLKLLTFYFALPTKATVSATVVQPGFAFEASNKSIRQRSHELVVAAGRGTDAPSASSSNADVSKLCAAGAACAGSMFRVDANTSSLTCEKTDKRNSDALVVFIV
jgi:hypothetical protein